MNKLLAVVVLVILVLVTIILLHSTNLSLFQLVGGTNVSETRYFRNDLTLLKSPTLQEVTTSVKPTTNYISLCFRIYISENMTRELYPLTSQFTYTGSRINLTKSVSVSKYTIPVNSYIKIEILYVDVYAIIHSITTFRTEVLNSSYVGGQNWTISFGYYFSSSSLALCIYYGTEDSRIDGFNRDVPPPICDFSYTPAKVYTDDVVMFDASYSQNSSKIVSYDWRIYEDSKLIYENTTTVPYLSYCFENSGSGSYFVSLTITDEYEQSSSLTKEIEVYEMVTSDFQIEGELYTCVDLIFYANVTSKYQVSSYVWNFGDGTENSTVKVSITHYYKIPGSYFVELKAIDVEGNYDIKTKTIVIENSTYKISVSPFKILKDVPNNIVINLLKNNKPYTFANLELRCADFSLTGTTSEFGNTTFTVVMHNRGMNLVEVFDLKYDILLGSFELNCLVEPMVQTQYSKQQFYNLMGENDFSFTVILLDPDNLQPVLNYISVARLTCNGNVIPSELVIDENRFTVTAKIFKFYGDETERQVQITVNVTSPNYYDVEVKEMVTMLAPVVDYWITSSESDVPLGQNIMIGTIGFCIKMLKPEYLNITVNNIYVEISSPKGKVTSNDLTITQRDSEIYVPFVFSEEGVYIIVVSFTGLPIFVPARTYFYNVQSLTITDYFSTYQQYIFIAVVLFIVGILIRRKKS